jgi:hypothetical protein
MALTDERRGHHLGHHWLVQGPALQGWLCAAAWSAGEELEMVLAPGVSLGRVGAYARRKSAAAWRRLQRFSPPPSSHEAKAVYIGS